MTHADKVKFKQLIASVYELYRKGKDLTPVTMGLWFNALEGYDIAVLSAAFSRHARNTDTGMYLPMPADIIKLIEGGSDDVALQAWSKIDAAIRRVGPYRSVVFDDHLIHYVVNAMGGWVKVCSFTEDDWKYQRQPFATLYRGARQREVEYPCKLLGIAEAENGEKHPEQPMLIGNETACHKVMVSGTNKAVLQMRPLRDAFPKLPPQQEANP